MSKALINGTVVTIYDFKKNDAGKMICSCYVPDLDIRQDYPANLIEVTNDSDSI